MKVLILSDAQSIHTKRWVSSLSDRGIDVVLYSIKLPNDDFFDKINIKTYYFDLFTYHNIFHSIVRHRKAVNILKDIIKVEKPDILHAHYLTSFALVAALSKFHPFIVSMWGSDVYVFPRKSFINKISVRYILRKADVILSTSHHMALEAGKYTGKEILITPFGVDTSIFSPPKEKRNDIPLVIGIVKTLSPNYAIDILLKVFKKVKDNNQGMDLKLIIAGDGPNRSEYEELARLLNLSSSTEFIGEVDNNKLATECYHKFSLFVALSHSESFGVVAVEAMACECPLVVSDTDGFTEVVQDGVTGLIVPRGDIDAAASAIQKLIDDPSLRYSMGQEGRKRVLQLYDWRQNVQTMVNIYQSTLSNHERA